MSRQPNAQPETWKILGFLSGDYIPYSCCLPGVTSLIYHCTRICQGFLPRLNRISEYWFKVRTANIQIFREIQRNKTNWLQYVGKLYNYMLQKCIMSYKQMGKVEVGRPRKKGKNSWTRNRFEGLCLETGGGGGDDDDVIMKKSRIWERPNAWGEWKSVFQGFVKTQMK